MKALLVTYGGGHVNLMIPVIREMERRGISYTVIGLTTAQGVLRREGVAYRTFRDYLEQEEQDEVRRYGEPLAERMHQEGKGVEREESVFYLGVSYRELVQEHGELVAEERMAAEGRQCFLPVRMMRRILEAERPDVVVASTAPRAELAAVLTAEQFGIPSLVIENLLGTSNKRYAGDRIAVMNELVRDQLMQQGVSGEKIVITGQPAFDSLFDWQQRKSGVRAGDTNTHGFADQQEHEEQQEQHEPSNAVILYASQPTQTRWEALAVLREALEVQPDWRLLIKTHPSENPADYQPHLTNGMTLVDGDVREWIAQSDLVVTEFSTVGLEALMMGKPLVTLNPSRRPQPVPYAELGIALEAGTARDFLECLSHFNNKHQLNKLLRKLEKDFTLYARASAQIVDLLELMATEPLKR